MRTHSLFRAGLVALLIPLLFAGCSNSPTAPRIVRDTGTVHYETLEGGFYAIRADGGVLYDPINLPEYAKIEGQRVRFTGRTRPDLASVHMVGPLLEIHSLELLP